MSVSSRLFTSTHAPAVDVHEAHRRQTAGALLVDVREPTEWQHGHAPDAVLIPLGSLPRGLADVPPDRDVLVLCRSGNRSGTAQRQLLQAGYTCVFNVSGGMNAWTSAGLPLAR
jgi:rhodanese-related sulfurtransferase